MDKTKINILNSVTKSYFQFQRHFPDRKSALFEDIKEVLNCTQEKAEKLASTHCNMVSFWACNFASGFTNMPYKTYFRTMLDKKFCNDKGRIIVGKDKVCKEIFGFNFDIEYIEEFEDILKPEIRMDKNCFYQMKMKADTEGDHFLSTYIDDVFFGTDTSYRGTPFKLLNKINQSNFQWLLKIQKSS